MDRRGFLLAASGLALAGCARVQPTLPGASPSTTPAPAAPLVIGQDGTPAGVVLGALLAGALAAKGRPADSGDLTSDWQAALGHGELAAVPGFAGTLWASLSTDDEQPAAAKLLGKVADLLAPEIGVLPVPGVDGQLVWRVSTESAGEGITSLSRIASWSKDKVALVPKLAVSRADGIPGLRAVYGARFRVTELEDPLERAERLGEGRAAIAAFRATEYAGAGLLVDLVDTEKLTTPDPAVVLVSSALADAEPAHVLALDAVAKALTTDGLVRLQAEVAAGGALTDVAARWLTAKGLA